MATRMDLPIPAWANWLCLQSRFLGGLKPYDKRVAGVISGAGNYKPGIVMDKQKTSGNRQPVALPPKVFRRVFLEVRGGLSLLSGHRSPPAAFASVQRFPDRSIHACTKQQPGMRVVRADGSVRHND